MKKIEVFRVTITGTHMYCNLDDIDVVQNYINKWLESEEVQFLKEHSSTPLERVNHENFTEGISFHATLGEKTEIFWRLKFR